MNDITIVANSEENGAVSVEQWNEMELQQEWIKEQKELLAEYHKEIHALDQAEAHARAQAKSYADYAVDDDLPF